jgi:hypothetical protein
LRKKCEKIIFFASLKLMKEGFDPEPDPDPLGSGDPNPDPDPHQNVTDPQHCAKPRGILELSNVLTFRVHSQESVIARGSQRDVVYLG